MDSVVISGVILGVVEFVVVSGVVVDASLFVVLL